MLLRMCIWLCMFAVMKNMNVLNTLCRRQPCKNITFNDSFCVELHNSIVYMYNYKDNY